MNIILSRKVKPASEELVEFVTKYISLIDTDNFDELYAQINVSLVPQLTCMLTDAEIDFLPYMTTIPNCFACDAPILHVKVPRQIRFIDQYAFEGSDIETIEFDEGCVASMIGYKAFSNSMLKRIVLPSKLDHIDSNAFNGCVYLEEVCIPASTQSIGDAPFGGCEQLKQLVYAGTLAEWDVLLSNSSKRWNRYSHIRKVYCSNGIYEVPYWS